MKGKRVLRAVVHRDAPRVLRVGLGQVWGQDGYAGRRWQVAQDGWRAQAWAAGMTPAEVWRALPASAFRLDVDALPLPMNTPALLAHYGVDRAELPALAELARTGWPTLFAPSWRPGGGDPGHGWHLDAMRAAREAQGA